VPPHPTDPATLSAQLEESAHLLELAVEAADLGLWWLSLEADTLKGSPRCRRIIGFPSEAPLTYRQWLGMLHPDDRDENHRLVQAAFDPRGEGAYRTSYRLLRPDGRIVWIAAMGQVEFVGEGPARRGLQLVGTFRDITAARQAEEARALLTRELSHRIKNIFAVVTSMVALSARDHPEAKPYASDLRERIDALSRAHDYVRPHLNEDGAGGGTTTIQGLLDGLLAPYRAAGSERIRIRCAETAIGERAATALALIVHEQATNAIKYGALAVPEGIVQIDGTRDGDTYRLRWREEGGRPIARAPDRQGFGTVLAARSARDQLGGSITYDWAATGLVIDIGIPVETLTG